MNRRPTFLGIGATRSATTWLHSMLKRHPKIYMPPVKEIHYFDRSPRYPSPDITKRESCRWWLRVYAEYSKAQDERTRHWYSNYLFGDINDQWYVSLFEDAEEGVPCGEITPAYSMLNVADIQNVYRINPDIKIIFQIRNPIDRAWSGLLQSLKRNGCTVDQIEDGEIRQDLTSSSSTARGDYLAVIDNWSCVFPESQIIVIYYDDIQQYPEKVMRKIVKFIEADDYPILGSGLYKKFNSSFNESLPAPYRSLLRELYADQLKLLYKKLDNPIVKSWLDE